MSTEADRPVTSAFGLDLTVRIDQILVLAALTYLDSSAREGIDEVLARAQQPGWASDRPAADLINGFLAGHIRDVALGGTDEEAAVIATALDVWTYETHAAGVTTAERLTDERIVSEALSWLIDRCSIKCLEEQAHDYTGRAAYAAMRLEMEDQHDGAGTAAMPADYIDYWRPSQTACLAIARAFRKTTHAARRAARHPLPRRRPGHPGPLTASSSA